MNYRNNRSGYAAQQNGRGYQQRGPRNQGQQGYHPNTGKLRINREKQSPKQPDFKGVGNIEIDGQMHTVFVSLWFNQDLNTGEETIRLTFTQPNGPQQQGGYQQQPRQNGHQRPQNNGCGGQGNSGHYYRDFQEPGYNQPQNGAMSRARPIPPQPQYHDEPPPYLEYPEGPEPGGYEPDGQ